MWATSAGLARGLVEVGFQVEAVLRTVVDLGVCQRKGGTDSVLPLRLKKALQAARQIGLVGMDCRSRATMVKTVVFSGGLYGVEVMAATQEYVFALRRAVAGALWKDRGPRNRVAALNMMHMDPWVHMCVQILTHWWRMAAK